MLVIQGIWAYGSLCLWAEDSTLPANSPPRPGRSSRAPRPHPFAADTEAVAGALTQFAGPVADLVRKAAGEELTLWLPATAEGPLHSPELSREPGEPARQPTGRARLAAWRVPALAFEPAAALDVLATVAAPGAYAAEAAIGGCVHYLAAVGRMAADLAGRGRVLPALTSGGGYVARWRPVLSGADVEHARALAGAMPPLCRASDADGEPSATVLTEALQALTDAAVRAALGPGNGDSRGPWALLPPRRGRVPAAIPVAERWIAALTAADPHVTVATREEDAAAAELAGALAEWRAAAQVPAGPVRTCFRLVEPGPGAGAAGHDTGDAAATTWAVEFALQSTEDPSLVISAADIWAADIWAAQGAAGWAGPAAGIRHPEEELLAGLGRAARLFPGLDAGLRSAAPASISTDAAGAYAFVKDTAPLLAGSGFGVLLPAWARKSRLGLKLTTRSKQTSRGSAGAGAPGFGLDDLVQFRYDLAVGGEALDPDELAELARLKVPLVRLRGQWVELDQRQLQAALRFMERSAAGTMRAGDALLAALHGGQEAAGLPVVEVDADGWLGDLLSGEADRRLEPIGTPNGFRGALRPYQERGLAWLAFLNGVGLGGILADDMGLGKTVQLLALLAAHHGAAHHGAAERAPAHHGAAAHAVADAGQAASEPSAAVRHHPTLLICPMSLAGNWQREAERFTPQLTVHVHHGADRLKGDELTEALAAADLVITTYSLAARDRQALAAVEWGRVVCDEAQNIKNSATLQAQAIRSLPAASKIALTGTPVENRLTELWSIMEFTNPGLLGSAERFRNSYAVPIERHGDEEAIAAVKRITGPFVLRRLKTDRSIISDLPDKLEMKVWCNLTAEQASLYQATVEDMLAKIEQAEEGIERRGLVLATMAKLKQVCNHPAHLLGDGSRLPGRSGKLARLEEICDEVLADGDKALCFTQYAEFGAMLQPYLAARLGCPVLYLHGGTAKRQRDALVTQFQESGEPALFLLSLKAGGTGLNLTAANHVIHVDRWWNPAVEDQATDRAFRIGQRKDVQVRKFICVGTLEERIDAMIDAKKALAERIVGTGEGWLTELSVAELRRVIALSPDAVSE